MAGKYKRIYTIVGMTLLSIFIILQSIGVQITSDGDKICKGSLDDPCISYIKVYNPTAKSIYIYNYDEVKFDFSPEIKEYKLYVKYYGKWRFTNFTMETRLGNIPKDRKYIFVFPRYSTKEFKLVGYKKNPFDKVKWGVGILDEDRLDPIWDSDSLDFKSCKDTLFYYDTSKTVCIIYKLEPNGTSTCKEFKKVITKHNYTKCIYDGKVRIGNKVISFENYFCIYVGNSRVDCVHINDGANKYDPSSTRCQEGGGMDCIIREYKNLTNYNTFRVNSEKYIKGVTKVSKIQ